jgi:hypothetical protein
VSKGTERYLLIAVSILLIERVLFYATWLDARSLIRPARLAGASRALRHHRLVERWGSWDHRTTLAAGWRIRAFFTECR